MRIFAITSLEEFLPRLFIFLSLVSQSCQHRPGMHWLNVYAKATKTTVTHRHALQDTIERTPAVAMQSNQSYQISSFRQEANAKQAACSKSDQLHYLLDSDVVETHLFSCWHNDNAAASLVTKTVHFCSRSTSWISLQNAHLAKEQCMLIC